jgi:hypothetical protein
MRSIAAAPYNAAMRTIPMLLVSGSIAVLLSACAVGNQQVGRPIDVERIAQLQVGRSTKADVLRLFGPPTSYSGLPPVPDSEAVAGAAAGHGGPPAGDAFVYEFREDRERFFTVLLFTGFRRQIRSDVLVVFFGPDDVVRYVAFAKQTDAGPKETGTP